MCLGHDQQFQHTNLVNDVHNKVLNLYLVNFTELWPRRCEIIQKLLQLLQHILKFAFFYSICDFGLEFNFLGDSKDFTWILRDAKLFLLDAVFEIFLQSSNHALLKALQPRFKVTIDLNRNCERHSFSSAPDHAHDLHVDTAVFKFHIKYACENFFQVHLDNLWVLRLSQDFQEVLITKEEEPREAVTSFFQKFIERTLANLDLLDDVVKAAIKTRNFIQAGYFLLLLDLSHRALESMVEAIESLLLCSQGSFTENWLQIEPLSLYNLNPH